MTTSTPRHILVAEDNPMNQLLMKKLLKQLGHTCVVVNNGLEALQILKQTKFDVILMDVQMPELDGIETTRRIRANPEFIPSPLIIALTANHLDKTRVDCLDAGADEFLTKPISISDLQEAINQRPIHQSLSNSANLAKRLDELVTMGDLPFVHELIDLFLQDSENRINEIESAAASLNWTEVQKISHLMKGSAANMGAEELRKISMVLNEAALKRDLNTTNIALRQAAEEFKRVEQQLTLWKQTT